MRLILIFYIANWHANAAGIFNSEAILSEPFETRSKSIASPKKRCVLPPYPENGGYVVMDEPNAKPGDIHDKVSFIQYTTSGDEKVIEIKNYKCTNGRWSLKIFKYESEKIYLNSSWCRLFQTEPHIEQWTVPITDESSGSSGTLQGYTQKTELCTLPPQPVSGSYTVINKPGANPGETFEALHLVYACETKRVRVGKKNVYCFNNVWSSEPPTCLRCGIVQNNDNSYAGGVDATLWELPWQVALYDKNFTPFKQICGGSIIASNMVISAAHCVWSDIEKLRPPQRFAVAAGKIFRGWNDPRNDYTQKSDVSEIKIPPRFRGSQTNFQDDIALIFVTTAFSYNAFVLPVCLDFDQKFDAEQLMDGKFGKVGGWGLITEDGKETQKLQTGWLPNVDINKCIDDAPPDFRVYVTSDKICAGYTNGSALCKGDSGGGIAFPVGQGIEPAFYLRGITSIAPTNDMACNVYAVTSFTHILAHQYFIKDHLTRAIY